MSSNPDDVACRLILLSGLAGSGKSTALNAFEDMGFFCVDNLPAPLVDSFADFLLNVGSRESLPVSETGCSRSRDFALLVDCRDEGAVGQILSASERLRAAGTEVILLYFDCRDEVLLRRYQETRRPHPLLVAGAKEQTMIEAFAKEREALTEFRAAATHILDTSSHSPHELRFEVEQLFEHERELQVVFLSFGFKYGAPQNADLVVDVRFLPNPHFVRDLRDFTGRDPKVVDYVCRTNDAEEFLTRFVDMLDFLIPRYQREGKRYLTIGVGCTGGKHRSVAISELLSKRIVGDAVRVSVRHRDIERTS